MKRKILAILCCCLLAFSVAGCSSPVSYQEATNTADSDTSVANGYFTLITKWNDGYCIYKIVYANDTKVKYLIAYNTSPQQGAYGITPLYNVDGSLQIYE